MRKTMKRVIACALAAALSLGTVLTSMAATPSPVTPKEPEKQENVPADGKFYRVDTEKSGELAIKASDTSRKQIKTVPARISVDGVKYTVTAVAPNAFTKWSGVETIILPNTVKSIKANAFTGCKSLKKIVLKNKTAVKVAKNSFKGLNTKKMTIKVKVKMTEKEYEKLLTNLRKAGFKGKILKK